MALFPPNDTSRKQAQPSQVRLTRLFVSSCIVNAVLVENCVPVEHNMPNGIESVLFDTAPQHGFGMIKAYGWRMRQGLIRR